MSAFLITMGATILGFFVPEMLLLYSPNPLMRVPEKMNYCFAVGVGLITAGLTL